MANDPPKVDMDEVRAKIISIRSKFPEIRAVFLFGSRVKGTQHALSDLDVALVFQPDDPSDFEGEYLAVGKAWRHDLRQIIPIEITIDFWPLDASDKTKYPETLEYVMECSECVYGHYI
jgi:predicted nucleotidyltransferase